MLILFLFYWVLHVESLAHHRSTSLAPLQTFLGEVCVCGPVKMKEVIACIAYVHLLGLLCKCTIQKLVKFKHFLKNSS